MDFCLLQVKMSKLYDRIVEIFEIGELNIDKANRRTLLKYATRTKFQKRREVFYSVCEDGKKSKVAICKTDERPQWVHNLDTLKTKQLRNQLKGFLKELGAFVNPQKVNLDSYAEKKYWHEVVFMDDDSKSGGSNTTATAPPENTPVRHHVSGAVNPRPRRRRESGAPRDAESREEKTDVQEEKKDEKKADMVAELSNMFAKAIQGHGDQLRNQDRDIGRLFDKMNKHGSRELDKEREREKASDRTHERLREITKLIKDRPVELPRPIELPPGVGGGDQEQLFKDSGVRVIERDGNKCVFLDEEEECVCKPKKWRHSEFNKEIREKLKHLAQHKAISCAKIDLLRCLSVEFRTQVKTWKRFNENCEGDYLSNITANHIRELLCKKQPVFSGMDLHTMKSVANAYDLSQNLCKGHADSMARFNDRKAIGKDYTLGHMDYEQVHSNVRKYNDPWSKAAFRNREPDPRPALTLICEKPDAPPEAVRVEMEPAAAPQLAMAPSGAVGFPSGMGGGGGGMVSGGGGGGVQRIAPPPRQLVTGTGSNFYPVKDDGGGRISGRKSPVKEFPVGSKPPSALCSEIAEWVRGVWEGKFDVSTDYHRMYNAIKEKRELYKDQYDPYLLDWMDKRLRAIVYSAKGGTAPDAGPSMGGSMQLALLKSGGKLEWPFTQKKLQYLYHLVLNVCEGNKIRLQQPPQNNCDRLELYLDKFNDAWMTGREWKDFWYEVNEVSRFSMQRPEYEKTMGGLKESFVDGGFHNQRAFYDLKKRLLDACRNIDKAEPTHDCLKLMYSIWLLRNPKNVPDQGESKIHQRADYAVKKLATYMHPQRSTTVLEIWRRFLNNQTKLSQKQFVWMCWEIYSTCIGYRSTGLQTDDPCKRMDFYLLMDWHTGGLDEDSFRQFTSKLMPHVLARVTEPQEATEMTELELEWRHLRVSGKDDQYPGLPEDKWKRFRALIAKWCDADTLMEESDEDRDFCKRLLDQIHMIYTTGLTDESMADVDGKIKHYINQTPPDSRAGWFAIWDQIKERAHIKQGPYDQFRYLIYDICMRAGGFVQELCLKIDFYLLTTATVGGLSMEGWRFIEAQIPTMIAKMVVSKEQTQAQKLWDGLKKNGKLSDYQLDDLRNFIWAACRMEGGGSGGGRMSVEDGGPGPIGDGPDPIPEKPELAVSPVRVGEDLSWPVKINVPERPAPPAPGFRPIHPVSPIHSGPTGVKPWQIVQPIANRPKQAFKLPGDATVIGPNWRGGGRPDKMISPIRASDSPTAKDILAQKRIKWPLVDRITAETAEQLNDTYAGMQLQHMLTETYSHNTLNSRLNQIQAALEDQFEVVGDAIEIAADVQESQLAVQEQQEAEEEITCDSYRHGTEIILLIC